MESLYNGKVESTDLVSLICFKVPLLFARSTALFYVRHATKNYLANEPTRRLTANTNIDLIF
ncbi:Uncharacterized protein FWK35_00014039 [Aphis craccivora]|uniref:Uncharacterized protein n=1 Tax=Aphis craccivora TaxID=307492 RepID=A0A6G0YY14_APHCR|nr:Uncharacterized protein FWK35_00014039 [Aphis craccivora]